MRLLQCLAHRVGAKPTIAALALTAFLCGGCEVKDFIDPSELGRYEHDPLQLRILENLDTRVEEPTIAEFEYATDVRPEDLVSTPTDYVIGANDIVTVSITDLVAPGVETVKTVKVTESGNISLPLVGPVKAEGKTEAELEQTVIEAYRNANLVQNAQVSTTVVEARARTFSVQGAVGQSALFPIIKSDYRMLDALIAFQNTASPLNKKAYIIRTVSKEPGAATEQAPAAPSGPDLLEPSAPSTPPPAPTGAAPAPATTAAPETAAPGTGTEEGKFVTIDGKTVMVGQEPVATTAAPAAEPATQAFEFNAPDVMAGKRVILVPLDKLKAGDLRYNVVIRPDDIIIVPDLPVGVYYLGGHVGRPGVYTFGGQNVTLKQAIISSGMLDGLAIPERTDVIRRIGPDREVWVRVNLDQIFTGTAPDFFLKPDDQVMVGTNMLAPFIAAVRGAFRFTYGFGFLYDKNFNDDDDDSNN